MVSLFLYIKYFVHTFHCAYKNNSYVYQLISLPLVFIPDTSYPRWT